VEKWGRGLILFGAAAAVAATLAAGGSTAAKKPILIGVTISQTGSQAATAAYVLQGYQRWVGDVNHHGGLLKRPVQLRVYDDKSDPATAAKLYTQLIATDKVDLIAGPYASGVTQAVIPVVEQAHKVLIGQTAATTLFDGARWAVQGFPQGSAYLPAIADLAKAHGYTRVALLSNDQPGTLEICAGVRARAQAIGLTVVYDQSYLRTTTTTAFGPVVAPLAATAPDVVVGCAFLSDSIALTREFDKQGVKPKLLALSIGPVDPSFGVQLGALADGVIGSTTWWPSLKTKGNAAFVASFEKTFHRTPIYHSAGSYAALQVLGAAVRKAGSLDQAKIRAALGKLDLRTVAGEFKIDAGGRQRGYTTYLMQWQGGKQVLVYPSAVAEATPKLPSR
jgi:branched-chain amino acid transport system substrate-binding protein